VFSFGGMVMAACVGKVRIMATERTPKAMATWEWNDRTSIIFGTSIALLGTEGRGNKKEIIKKANGSPAGQIAEPPHVLCGPTVYTYTTCIHVLYICIAFGGKVAHISR